jgi:hypothetical protein
MQYAPDPGTVAHYKETPLSTSFHARSATASVSPIILLSTVCAQFQLARTWTPFRYACAGGTAQNVLC